MTRQFPPYLFGYLYSKKYFGNAVNLTPLLGEKYNEWVPFLILVMCIVYILGLHNKITNFFTSNSIFSDSLATDSNIEGRNLLEQGFFN